MRRLDTVTKLLNEVQETLRDILDKQVDMGDEEFIRVNLDIQKLHSVKELIKLPLYNDVQEAVKVEKSIEDSVRDMLDKKKKDDYFDHKPYVIPMTPQPIGPEFPFDERYPYPHRRDIVWAMGIDGQRQTVSVGTTFDESGR